MERFFGQRKKERPEEAAKAVDEPSTEPIPVQEYFNPDTANGRARIIVMLSEDRANIEPILRARLDATEQFLLMVKATATLSDDIFQHVRSLQEENLNLQAEVDFLRAQVAKNAQPPPEPIRPAPFSRERIGAAT